MYKVLTSLDGDSTSYSAQPWIGSCLNIIIIVIAVIIIIVSSSSSSSSCIIISSSSSSSSSNSSISSSMISMMVSNAIIISTIMCIKYIYIYIHTYIYSNVAWSNVLGRAKSAFNVGPETLTTARAEMEKARRNLACPVRSLPKTVPNGALKKRVARQNTSAKHSAKHNAKNCTEEMSGAAWMESEVQDSYIVFPG